MRTSLQIAQKGERIHKQMTELYKSRIRSVHPETGGNMMLASNWGNESAASLVREYNRRSEYLTYLRAAMYYKAEADSNIHNHGAWAGYQTNLGHLDTVRQRNAKQLTTR